jgi:hypothetical protein
VFAEHMGYGTPLETARKYHRTAVVTYMEQWLKGTEPYVIGDVLKCLFLPLTLFGNAEADRNQTLKFEAVCRLVLQPCLCKNERFGS